MTASAPTATTTTYGSDSGRARLPDQTGFATSSDGVRLAFDVYGAGEPTIAFLPSTPIIHARQWKGQIPYLSRHFRVVAYDGRGNGRSDRPTTPEAYTDDRVVDDVDGRAGRLRDPDRRPRGPVRRCRVAGGPARGSRA